MLNRAVVDWNLSGRSAQEPMVIGSYGDPNLPRPRFVTGTSLVGFSTESRSRRSPPACGCGTWR